jgi:hypothetical protein
LFLLTPQLPFLIASLWLQHCLITGAEIDTTAIRAEPAVHLQPYAGLFDSSAAAVREVHLRDSAFGDLQLRDAALLNMVDVRRCESHIVD